MSCDSNASCIAFLLHVELRLGGRMGQLRDVRPDEPHHSYLVRNIVVPKRI